jgi:hypothetical protein
MMMNRSSRVVNSQSCGAVLAHIDLYHWSTPRFSSVWQDTLSVLVARGRARVSVSASAADWPKRIRDMQYVDHDDFAAAHYGPP